MQSVRRQDCVQLLPRLRLLHLRLAVALDPSKQTLDARMVLHVCRTVLCPNLARHVVVLAKAEFVFERIAHPGDCPVSVEFD